MSANWEGAGEVANDCAHQIDHKFLLELVLNHFNQFSGYP